MNGSSAEPRRRPDHELPPVVAALGRRLPQGPPALLLGAVLNLAVEYCLARSSLDAMKGRTLRLRVIDAGLDLALAYDGRRFSPSSAPADLTLTARACDFLALATREEDADTLFFQRRLLMTGDTELGVLVKNTLDAAVLPPWLLAGLAKLRNGSGWWARQGSNL